MTNSRVEKTLTTGLVAELPQLTNNEYPSFLASRYADICFENEVVKVRITGKIFQDQMKRLSVDSYEIIQVTNTGTILYIIKATDSNSDYKWQSFLTEAF